MNKLIYMLLIVLAFISCNGGKTKKDTLKESVEKFKDTLGTLEIEEYIPKEYTEVKTDTLLSNGFSISIKTYTDMNRSVKFKYKVDATLTHIDHFRDWISEVKIKKNDVLIFNKKLDANFFLEQDKTLKDSLNKAINNKVWINEDFPLEKNHVYLLGGFIFPKAEKVLYYDIKIDSKGNYSIKEIEDY
ncbi:hypothetical protein ACFSKN_01660 [Mariniflexile gromovii]|uniref:PepSY-like beta-lactamase-inhibitor n=1 Tax=Mariniflexile gromovii TaxID=362523 RepID=A0ABS4BPG7_9FLAO|nr:hypothetical protein [Mariniflexile gromovii]MBP0902308.1 hypothetical protein [Mariniflexile gromovii]